MDFDQAANQFLEMIGRANQRVIDAFPNLVAAVLVLLAGWGLASVLRKLVRRLLRKATHQLAPGSTRAAWTEAVGSPRTGDVAANGVYWLVLLTALMVAIDALGLSVFSRWIDAFAGYLPRFAIAMALLFGGVIAGRLARNAIANATLRVPASQARSLGRLVQVSIVVATALIAASQLGLDVSLLTAIFLIGLAATLGGAALAFGLGAKDMMADILAMHYVHKSYRVGQTVRLGTDQGRIVRTTRTTVVLENADGELSIPGRHFAENRLVLLTHEEAHDSRD